MPTTIQPMIMTTDAERLAAFYTGLLGATETRRVPDDGPVFFLGLKVDDAELGIVSDDSVDASVAPRVLISIDVPDVDGLLDRVGELGGKVLSPPDDMPWGQRVCHVLDPDGNPVNLTQPVSTG
jgi:predicted enzyme related to lactoylglutathione lyase